MDEALEGGIPNGNLTEFVGPAGIGKSQFCLMLTFSALQNPLKPAELRISCTYLPTCYNTVPTVLEELGNRSDLVIIANYWGCRNFERFKLHQD